MQNNVEGLTFRHGVINVHEGTQFRYDDRAIEWIQQVGVRRLKEVI